MSAAIHSLIRARDTGDAALLDPAAFAAAVAAVALQGAGLPFEAELAIDAHTSAFSLSDLESRRLRELVSDSIAATRLRRSGT